MAPGTVTDLTDVIDEINSIIDRRDVSTVFQPLVHLASGEVVGYEALIRGPRGSPLEDPLSLLSAARSVGRLAELDWVAIGKAYEAAAAARLHPSMTIFLNLEPATILVPCPPDLVESIQRARHYLRVVIEMKERALLADPANLFDELAEARDIGWGIAIDNAGASEQSVALMPLVQPDVIKVDLRMVRKDLASVAAMCGAARAYAEHNGGTVLAQGLEESDDIMLARTVGATYGQGWLFGRPGPLPTERSVPRAVFPLQSVPPVDPMATPFQIVSRTLPSAVTEKRFLTPVSEFLESQVGYHADTMLMLSLERRMDERGLSIEQLERLARMSAFFVGVGPGLESRVWTTGRTVPADAEDPICSEWDVIVVGPHFAGALVARDLGDDVSGPYRRFEYVVTHDRNLVLQASRAVVRRVRATLQVP